jgi:aldehyde:ferredoxin oxidoreductase
VYGVHGQYLRIDLSKGCGEVVPLAEPVLRAFLGGVGLGAWLVAHETPAGADPLAPEAAIAFVFSPLVGSPLTTSAKFAVAAISPLTGRFCDALSSSRFALGGKRTGCDAIVVTGRAGAPSAVLVDGMGEGGVRVGVVPAAELHGLSAAEAERRVREQHGADWQVAAIGPAGEQLIPFATISHDGRHAGRGGLGAMLGAKRVKALAVRGDHRAPLADPVGAVALAKGLSARSFGPATEKYRELGTVANLLVFNRFEALPTRNFQAGRFEGVEKLAENDLGPARRLAKNSCASCTIGCEHVYALDGTKTPGSDGGVRMEYESLFALGSLCGVNDPDAVLRAAALCDHHGLDTITTGGTIAFLMECAERGWLDGRLPGTGRVLEFGDPAALVEAVEALAGRRGELGALLALGSRRAAERLGGEALGLAPHVKGLELPGYHPGRLPTMALGLAVGTRGADHNRSGAYEADFSERLGVDPDSAELARAAVATEDRAALLDALILCKFLRGALADLHAEAAAMLEAVTGWDVTVAELRTVARRIVTARKCLNIREGWTRAEDTLPARLFTASAGSSGRPPLTRTRLEAQVAAYYRERGWTDDGDVPASLRAELVVDGPAFGVAP